MPFGSQAISCCPRLPGENQVDDLSPALSSFASAEEELPNRLQEPHVGARDYLYFFDLKTQNSQKLCIRSI